uniref:Uncharacterized protein n=2 Tax=Caenorhabditis tropicalis TaxID=1561998 RepID=A0A1I7U7R1_9PELO
MFLEKASSFVKFKIFTLFGALLFMATETSRSQVRGDRGQADEKNETHKEVPILVEFQRQYHVHDEIIFVPATTTEEMTTTATVEPITIGNVTDAAPPPDCENRKCSDFDAILLAATKKNKCVALIDRLDRDLNATRYNCRALWTENSNASRSSILWILISNLFICIK